MGVGRLLLYVCEGDLFSEEGAGPVAAWRTRLTSYETLWMPNVYLDVSRYSSGNSGVEWINKAHREGNQEKCCLLCGLWRMLPIWQS